MHTFLCVNNSRAKICAKLYVKQSIYYNFELYVLISYHFIGFVSVLELIALIKNVRHKNIVIENMKIKLNCIFCLVLKQK